MLVASEFVGRRGQGRMGKPQRLGHRVGTEPFAQMHHAVGPERERTGKGGILVERPLRELERAEHALGRGVPECSHRPHEGVVGIETGGRLAQAAMDLGLAQVGLDGAGDLHRHPVVQLEDVFERAVEPVRPEMRPVAASINCAGDADAVAGLAHDAFEHIAHAKFAADLLMSTALPL